MFKKRLFKINIENKRILITGSAGFIGYHISKKLLEKNWTVLGIDAMTSYYDPLLKESRNAELANYSEYSFHVANLEDNVFITKIFQEFRPRIVIHLAAQAGVRYSIDNPTSYVKSNLIGTFNILEALKNIDCEHFLMASTSSVYGRMLKTI